MITYKYWNNEEY